MKQFTFVIDMLSMDWFTRTVRAVVSTRSNVALVALSFICHVGFFWIAVSTFAGMERIAFGGVTLASFVVLTYRRTSRPPSVPPMATEKYLLELLKRDMFYGESGHLQPIEQFRELPSRSIRLKDLPPAKSQDQESDQE